MGYVPNDNGHVNRTIIGTRSNALPQYRTRTVALRDPSIRKGKTRYAGAGERGYRDAWAGSPYYSNAVTIDARWSA